MTFKGIDGPACEVRHNIFAAGTVVCNFVDASEQRRWYRQSERLGGPEVDDQLGLRGLLERQIEPDLSPWKMRPV
jgi:hypothetical protein